GRVVRGCYDDAVGEMLFTATVVDENSVRDNRRRGYPIVLLNDGFDIVAGQHLERGTLRRPGHRVGVFANIQWSVGPLAAPVMASMWASLNEPCSGEPRCPLVPKLTNWLGSPMSGRSS